MIISLTQLTVLILLFTAVIAFIRGWGREVITAAIVLGTLLFLLFGGGALLAHIFGGSSATSGMGSALSNFLFTGMTALAYWAGAKHGTAPASANHRFTALIPGLVTGGAISYYVGQHFFPAAQGMLNALNVLGFLAALPVLMGLAIIGLIVTLFVSHNNKSAKAH